MEPKVEYNGSAKNCYNCEYNINEVCVIKKDTGASENLTIERARRMFPGGCDDWSLSLQVYMRESRN